MTAPAMKLRDGTLQVLIWRNTSTSGQTYYSITPQRSYRDGDDTWRETDSLNADDALPMRYKCHPEVLCHPPSGERIGVKVLGAHCRVLGPHVGAAE